MSRSGIRFLAAILLVILLGAPTAIAEQFPFGVKIEKVLDNTAELGNLRPSPTGELWLLERASGTVRVFVQGKPAGTLAISVTNTCQSGLLDAAFASDYGQSGLAFVSYVDASGRLKVDRVLRNGAALSLAGNVLDVAAVTDFCRPGGGLTVGADGKLYLATGDLGVSGNAQSDAHLAGKVLRANADGSIPADNPNAGSLVWAKGFRNAKGLAYNPSSARAGGTFYGTDLGNSAATTASDEINCVDPTANYAWDVGSGSMGNPSYHDPLTSFAPTSLIAPESITVLGTSAFGESLRNALVYAAPTNEPAQKGSLRQIRVKGAELDEFDQAMGFFNPNLDLDGTADPQCPTRPNAVTTGNDGWLYMSNIGANPGIWRLYNDRPGPREVSASGSPFPLSVERSGGNLVLGWETLGSLDAGRAKRYATGQRAEAYRVFEGTLPITGGSYNHAAILSTNGTADGINRLTAGVTPGSGNRYYLVGAQNDNLEGALGRSSSGSSRPVPGTNDYCELIGWGRSTGTCAREFQNESSHEILKLKDYNRRSPTYGQYLNLADFRGLVIKLALTAKNCFWCTVEAQQEATVDRQYRDRDFLFVSVFTVDYGIWHVYNDAQCDTEINAWANAYNTDTPILCDVDANGDGYGDISNWFDQCNCAPQNFYIDQGGVIYNYVQGAQFSSDVISNITSEVNPPGCD